MTDRDANERLRALLQSGDPAGDGSEPTAEETAWLRRLTLNQVPDQRPLRRWLSLTAAAVLVVAIVVLTPPGTGDKPLATDPPSLTPAPDAPPPLRQQVQFATHNGTRIIWVLDPELKL